MPCCSLWDRIQPWLRDYDHLQSLAVLLIYVQVACSLIGSLGALYNGVLLINLAIALFALVAIESSSQSLGRTYAILLFCALLLDVFWFILFSHEIWTVSSASYGSFFAFSVKLTLAMQILAFSVRFSSSLIWIQIYRLGATPSRDTNFDLRNSFLSPATPLVTPCAHHDDAVTGGSIYDPVYYSSLFEERRDGLNVGPFENFSGNGSNSSAEDHPVKQSPGRSFHSVDVGTEDQVKQSPGRSFHAVDVGVEDHQVKQSPGRPFHADDVLEENTTKTPQCV